MFDFTDKSVAVVGSSGHLLERNYSQLIDSHDIVIRFNQARVAGFEDYVGSKTTHRIVNTHTFLGTTGNDRFPKNDSKFITKLKEQHILINRPVPQNSIKTRAPFCDVSVLSDNFWFYCKDLLNNLKDPSVGFIGVILAVSTSKKVSVYGFDQNSSIHKKHYWEEVKRIGDHHNFNTEKEYFKLLEDKNIIRIFK